MFEARFRPESQSFRASYDICNCGVTTNAMCRYTVYHTENTNHLDQHIGIIWHTRSMLVTNNTAECNVSQDKRNNHETMHDDAIDIKETF